MRIRIERTYLTTASGSHVIDSAPESTYVEAGSLREALLQFIQRDEARLLGTIVEAEARAVATVWRNRVYFLTAEPAAD